MKRKLLVTGCARSGTLYTTKVLRAIGLRVGHEYTDEDGTVSHFFGTTMNLEYPLDLTRGPRGRVVHQGERPSDFEFEQVFHQVRDPRKVIASLRFTTVDPYTLFKVSRINVHTMNHLRRAVIYWVVWNEVIEKQRRVDLRYRIEDFSYVFPEILARLDLPHVALPPVPTDTHTERRWRGAFAIQGQDEKGRRTLVGSRERKRLVLQAPDLTFDDIEKVDPVYGPKAVEMAWRYGYA